MSEVTKNKTPERYNFILLNQDLQYLDNVACEKRGNLEDYSCYFNKSDLT